MREFHRFRTLPHSANSFFIALIVKCENFQGLGDFKPISFIGRLYKILAKLLANWLRRVLEWVIDQSQSAFLRERQLLNSVLIANKAVDEAKRRKRKYFVFKVDFEKAYDSLSSGFLRLMLGRMVFHERWILWIKGCLQSLCSLVLVNESLAQEFKCYKGLHQGDPLTPFLFLIVVER